MNKSCSLIVFLIALIKWDYSFVPCMLELATNNTHIHTDITYTEPRIYEVQPKKTRLNGFVSRFAGTDFWATC